MKHIKKSISLVPPETVTQQLEELSRITRMTPRAIVDDIVTFELAAMFGSTDDSTDVDASTRSLQRYLYRHDYSREQATKVAAAYNAFVVRQAEHSDLPATNAAVVRSEPDERGFFQVWFPLLASRVERIAKLAQMALKAAA